MYKSRTAVWLYGICIVMGLLARVLFSRAFCRYPSRSVGWFRAVRTLMALEDACRHRSFPRWGLPYVGFYPMDFRLKGQIAAPHWISSNEIFMKPPERR